MRERLPGVLAGSASAARTAGAGRAVGGAAARRDQRLAQIRKLSLWITGSAAAASLGLGTAFAHALPGHHAAEARHAAHGRSVAGAAPAGGGTTGATGTSRSAGSGSSGTGHSSHQQSAGHKLAAPAQHPAAAPSSAPVVSSGGS